MLSNELQEYIQKRLQAGENPETIARTIHGWGWRTTHSTIIPSKLASPPPMLHIVVGIMTVFAVLAGGTVLYATSNSKTQSITDAVVTSQEISPHTRTNNSDSSTNQAAILGATTASPSAELLPDTTATTAASLGTKNTATSSADSIHKSEYTVALIGDSMIDTLDSYLPKLAEQLKDKYDANFKIYNYGVGAQNVEMGLARFSEPFNYKGREYPPLSELKPDILIIGSFAYNPFSAPDINKYWLTMASLAEHSQATKARVYFLADIAPVKEKFGVGSLDWNTDSRIAHSQKIVDQLNSFTALSKTLNIPLIDVYSLTQDNGPFGSGEYTDAHDGIHANEKGRTLVINQIVKDLIIE